MKDFYAYDDHSEEAEQFRHISNLVYLEAEKTGIRAALDKYAELYPIFSEALEAEAEVVAELDFMAHGDDSEEEPFELSDKLKETVRDAVARSNGFYIHEDAKFIWDGNCWTDPLGNGHSTLAIAIAFYSDC